MSIARYETPPNTIFSNESSHCFKEVLGTATKIEDINVAGNSQKKKKDPNAPKKLVAQNKGEVLKTVSLQRQSFLHFLVSKPAFDMSISESFAVQNLVAKMLLQPESLKLLLAIDNNNNTPLHTAVQYSNHNFMSAVSGPPNQAQTVDQVCRTLKRGKNQWARCRSRSTFLHEALASRTLFYNEKLVRALIAMTPSVMLRPKDIHRQTPLHLAVEHLMYTAQGIVVIIALVAGKPSVLEIMDNKKCSVY